MAKKNISVQEEKGTPELILINITGADRTGLTAELMETLAKYDATVLDIGQADIHHNLSLGILFKTVDIKSGDILKELLVKTNAMKIQVSFSIISPEEYNDWVSRQGKNRYIITILGRKISAKQIAATARIISSQGLNIDSITRLTGRIPLDDTVKPMTKACIEFSVRGTPKNMEGMQAEFMSLSKKLNYDISLQEDTIYRRSRRLICFDMDSTLIETEVIDELADRAGVGDQVRAITESAMRGEIDFEESFRRRVALLKGLDISVMKEIAENLPIAEGLERLMSVLKRSGYKTAILSGGFTYFGNYLKQKYNFDYVYANELEVGPDGKLTGNYVGDIVDGKRKKELLRLLAQVENINIAQTIAVGDGANDLPMLSEAGLGIAFHAKPKVKAEASQSISTIGIDGILYFLGFKDSYITPSEKDS
ncbi:MAG: phosphoserine phosphatase SerB [Muribaculaceae bacterium]|nr:phosphoserine phosphatase SerB [Muribaculaceae bacterium]